MTDGRRGRIGRKGYAVLVVVVLTTIMLAAVVRYLRPTVTVQRQVAFVQADTRVLDALEKGDEVEIRAVIAEQPTFPLEWREGGRTALHRAAERGHSEVVRILLEAGADVNARVEGDWAGRGNTPLIFAASSGDLRTVQTLIEFGADVSIRGQFNKTAEDLARVSKNDEIARYLADLSAAQRRR